MLLLFKNFKISSLPRSYSGIEMNIFEFFIFKSAPIIFLKYLILFLTSKVLNIF